MNEEEEEEEEDGEEEEEEVDNAKEEIEGTQPFSEHSGDMVCTDSTHSGETTGPQPVMRAWPKPPDVDNEGQQLTESEDHQQR